MKNRILVERQTEITTQSKTLLFYEVANFR